MEARIKRLTYAVGDIHGRLDLMEKMLQKIKADAALSHERPLIIFLGDYVDRGPHSKGVLDGILTLEDEEWCDVEFLMGNHEETLLKFLNDPSAGLSWSDHGGAATLASYGVSLPHLRSDPLAWNETRDEFAQALPESHRQLMAQMKMLVIADDYLFVHAGVRPNTPLEDQGAETFLWIRSPFLAVDKACKYVVVHGHTPEEAPTNTRWRIGLDTGAYATSVLTAVRLKDNTRTIFQVT
ncbi:metallophosphoesterase family protein [Asticcacaulis sp. 201]|uniref:metallophosphoesterase family protein n=1 Tax=Asticcacaulis sp. 201 TaxID=3028787 RepID=UPI002915F88D|nr:metallophosphoesterase family protein [Asticcacaulis sp. 201]MDV6331079.1 metallophosphoesterase family protein [Asticcacaulis sp. 201]